MAIWTGLTATSLFAGVGGNPRPGLSCARARCKLSADDAETTCSLCNRDSPGPGRGDDAPPYREIGVVRCFYTGTDLVPRRHSSAAECCRLAGLDFADH